MAADPDLAAARLAGALRACFSLIMQPDALPEFQLLQVRLGFYKTWAEAQIFTAQSSMPTCTNILRPVSMPPHA